MSLVKKLIKRIGIKQGKNLFLVNFDCQQSMIMENVKSVYSNQLEQIVKSLIYQEVLR